MSKENVCCGVQQDAAQTEDNEFVLFRQHLLDQSRSREFRRFVVGSEAEIPMNYYSMICFQLSDKNEDVDHMYYDLTKDYAFPRGQCVPEKFKGEVLRINTNHMHSGYVKLIREADK